MTPTEFWALLWGADGDFHELRVEHAGRLATLWIPCVQQRAVVRMLTGPCEISLVPRFERHELSFHHAHLLWCRLQTGDATRRLERFQPGPTLVIREGMTVRRWALWALSVPLRGPWIERATERLSYALHGLRRAANPSTLIPTPFAASDEPRRPWIEYETSVSYTPRDVVGQLRDAPDPQAWKNAA